MKKIILALCPVLVAGSAFAGSYNPPSDNDATAATMVKEETVSSKAAHSVGPYASLAIGATRQSVQSTVDSSNRGIIGGQANVGYSYAINDKMFIGPELGWGYYGNVESHNTQTTATDLVAAGRYYFDDQANLVVKAGGAYVDGNGDKNTVPMTGLGLGYDLNCKLSTNITYYHTYGKKQDFDKTDSVFVGFSYFI